MTGDGHRRRPATSNGEIALGKNALIGFMTWEGYNYEDAVLLNERMVRMMCTPPSTLRSMKLKPVTPSLGRRRSPATFPTWARDVLKELDERGIIRVGAEVRAGDIPGGQGDPKGETELTAEERLLRAIFGEKAREVRDTSCVSLTANTASLWMSKSLPGKQR